MRGDKINTTENSVCDFHKIEFETRKPMKLVSPQSDNQGVRNNSWKIDWLQVVLN